jgi:hypothetical protein
MATAGDTIASAGAAGEVLATQSAAVAFDTPGVVCGAHEAIETMDTSRQDAAAGDCCDPPSAEHASSAAGLSHKSDNTDADHRGDTFSDDGDSAHDSDDDDRHDDNDDDGNSDDDVDGVGSHARTTGTRTADGDESGGDFSDSDRSTPMSADSHERMDAGVTVASNAAVNDPRSVSTAIAALPSAATTSANGIVSFVNAAPMPVRAVPVTRKHSLEVTRTPSAGPLVLSRSQLVGGSISPVDTASEGELVPTDHPYVRCTKLPEHWRSNRWRVLRPLHSLHACALTILRVCPTELCRTLSVWSCRASRSRTTQLSRCERQPPAKRTARFATTSRTFSRVWQRFRICASSRDLLRGTHRVGVRC